MFFSRFTQKNQYLQIQANDIDCCVALARIYKLFSLMALRPVLGAPSYLAGVFNLYGNIVPVIDLSLRLGQLSTVSYTCNTCVIICRAFENDAFLGLIVSSVGNIIELTYDDLQLAPHFSGKTLPFSSIYQQQNQVFFVLNIDALLDSSIIQICSLPPDEVSQVIKTQFTFDNPVQKHDNDRPRN